MCSEAARAPERPASEFGVREFASLFVTELRVRKIEW
jgi:hypothetical protein